LDRGQRNRFHNCSSHRDVREPCLRVARCARELVVGNARWPCAQAGGICLGWPNALARRQDRSAGATATEVRKDSCGRSMRISGRTWRALVLGAPLWVCPVLAQDTAARAASSLKVGENYLKSGDLRAAEKQLLQAVSLNSQNPQTYNLLGFVCDQTGRVEQAFQYYKTALKLDPSVTAARNNLGAADFRQGRIDHAVEECLRALR